MPLTAYEKFNVEAGKEVIVKGMVKFNALNKQLTPKPTDVEPDPAPRTTIELVDPKFYGDASLAKALNSKRYGDNEECVSFVNKGNFLPTLFDINNEEKSADEVIPENKALAENQVVLVHVRSFEGKQNNIGASFDSVKFPVPFDQVKFANIGVSADVFDDLGNEVQM